jgi:hypothetical protein
MHDKNFIGDEEFNQSGGGLVTTIGGLIIPAGLVILQNTLNKSIDLENLYKKTENTINDDTYDKLINLASAKQENHVNKVTRRFNRSKQNNKSKKNKPTKYKKSKKNKPKKSKNFKTNKSKKKYI